MEVSDTQIRSMRLRGVPVAEIAARTGSTVDAIEDRVRVIWASAQATGARVIVDPTPETIMLEASAIRLKWSPEEERKRRGCISEGWAPPDASPDLCLVMEQQCSAPSRQSLRSNRS